MEVMHQWRDCSKQQGSLHDKTPQIWDQTNISMQAKNVRTRAVANGDRPAFCI